NLAPYRSTDGEAGLGYGMAFERAIDELNVTPTEMIPRLVRSARPHRASSSLTHPPALPKSVLPASPCFSPPLTMPQSLMLVAPVALMTSATTVFACASGICLGR